MTSNWDKLWKIVRPKCFERVLFCADAETSAQQSLSGSCAWASTLNQGDTVSLWFWGEGYWRVSVQLCERLTGCEYRDWKKLPSPGCQVWFSRDKEGLKLPPSFWWWVKSKSVISAYFLPVCLPGSPFASAVSDTNRVLCPKLPAQGNRGNGTVNLEVPWPC